MPRKGRKPPERPYNDGQMVRASLDQIFARVRSMELGEAIAHRTELQERGETKGILYSAICLHIEMLEEEKAQKRA